MADTSFYGSRKSVGGSHSLKLKQEAFSFPLLKNHEIIECLAELNVSMDEADLAKARPAQLRHIYELLLCDCLDMSKEELYQPKFVGLDALQHTELHEESIPVLHFVRGMDKLLKACGISGGFNLIDLLKPDPRRVRRNLSAIINFHKFREERLAVFTQFTERGEQLAATKAQLEDERAQLEAQIAQILEARREEQPEVAALQEECSKCEDTITQLNETQARIRSDTNTVKERIASLKDEVAAVQFETLSTEEDKEATARLLVASPDRVKAEVAHMESSAFAEKAALKEAEDTKRSLKGQLSVIAQAESDVKQLSAALSDFSMELHRSQECAGQVATAQRGVDLQAAEAAEMEAEREHMQGQVKRLQEKLADVRASHEAKSAAITRAVENMQAEYSALMKDGDAASELHQAGVASQEELQAQLDAAKAQHESEMTTLLDDLRELQREVKNYHAKLFAGVDSKALQAQ